MRYKVVATGGDAPPNGYQQDAGGAQDALDLLPKMRKLFQRAKVAVQDEHGREVGDAELRTRAMKERTERRDAEDAASNG